MNFCRLDARWHIAASCRSRLGCSFNYVYFQRCNHLALMNSRTAITVFGWFLVGLRRLLVVTVSIPIHGNVVYDYALCSSYRPHSICLTVCHSLQVPHSPSSCLPVFARCHANPQCPSIGVVITTMLTLFCTEMQ